MILNYYQIDQFTRRIAALFEVNQIPYVLLKGISSTAFYPVSEYRKLGDVDLYINEKEQFDRAGKLLLSNGFKRMMMSATIIKATFTHFLKLAEP